MENTFKIGDIVITNAGTTYSPVMAIKWIEKDECLCIWYNKLTNHFEEYKLPYQMLRKV